MIKFGMTTIDGRPIIGVGLSRGNTERLLQGDPIYVDLADWGPEAERFGLRGKLLIIAGETEQSMALDLVALQQEHEL